MPVELDIPKELLGQVATIGCKVNWCTAVEGGSCFRSSGIKEFARVVLDLLPPDKKLDQLNETEVKDLAKNPKLDEFLLGRFNQSIIMGRSCPIAGGSDEFLQRHGADVEILTRIAQTSIRYQNEERMKLIEKPPKPRAPSRKKRHPRGR